MTIVFNRKPDTTKRKSLRNRSTATEKILWNELKQRKVLGTKFRRQFGISSYVVDFYSPDIRLAIEIDGGIHNTADSLKLDILRQNQIEALNIKFLRFSTDEVENNISEVIEKIQNAIISSPFTRGRKKEGV